MRVIHGGLDPVQSGYESHVTRTMAVYYRVIYERHDIRDVAKDYSISPLDVIRLVRDWDEAAAEKHLRLLEDLEDTA